MAEAFHNDLLPATAESAGLRVDAPGDIVGNWSGGAEVICQSMDEIDKSIKNKTRTQFSETQAKLFARVVYILAPEQVPDNLNADDEKVIYWPMDDPRDMSLERVRVIRDQIGSSVSILLNRTSTLSYL